MADDPLYDERGIALTSVECDPLSRSEIPDALPIPVEVPCDPQGNPLPEEFLPVRAPAQPVPTPEEPPAFPIRNRPYTAVCEPPLLSSPTSPVSYTVDAPLTHPPGPLEQGTTTPFRPAEIFELTDSQKAYITTSLQDPARKAAVATFLWDVIQAEDDMGVLLDTWLPITGWSSALSTIVITAALAQQAELNTTAQLLAESFLECGYYNPPVVVCCDETEDAGYAVVEDPLPGVECVTVNAATYFSVNSQLEATNRAIAAAVTQLECIYWNFTAEASCETLYPLIFGTPEAATPHPILTAPLIPGDAPVSVDLRDLDGQEFAVVGLPALVKLVYYATVPADTVPAASQAEADAIAYNMAIAQLNCFFPSDWLEVDCTTEVPAFTARAGATSREATLDEITYPGITTAHNEVFTQVTEPVLLDEQKTVYVTSPTGAFISTTAQTEATDSAEQYAVSLLECLWRSPGISCACYEPVTPGQDVYLYDDTEMADALAKAPGLITFNAEKSANNHVIPGGAFVTPEFPGNDLSDSDPWATAGLDLICLSYLSCLFCNVQIEPECAIIYKEIDGNLDIVDLASLPGQTLPLTIPPEYADYAISPTFKAGLLPEVVCNTDPGSVGAQADSLSRLKPSTDTICIYGNPETFVDCMTVLSNLSRADEFPDLTEASQAQNVTVPENMFTAGGATPEDAINAAIAAALAYGTALLVCEFGNDPKTGNCEGDYDTELSTISSVEAEAFTSVISKDDANRQAQIYIDLNTVCFYTNDPKTGECGDDYNAGLSTITTADAGDFVSQISKDDANRQAQSYVDLNTLCFYCNDPKTGDCDPCANEDISSIPDLAACDFISTISKEDATRSADQYILLNTLCCFKSKEVTLNCPEDAKPRFVMPPSTGPNPGECEGVGGQADYTETLTGVVVPEGAFEACSTQEDANRAALNYALSLLVCIYGNDPDVGECEDPCYDPAISNIPEVEADQFLSLISKEDANRQALAFIKASTTCCFSNVQIEVTCPDDAANPNVPPASDFGPKLVGPPGTGCASIDDAATTKTALGVIVPAGTFTSCRSQEEANTAAYNFARTSITCFWCNDFTPASECPVDSESLITDPDAVLSVEECTFLSQISKEDANKKAREYADSLQLCGVENKIQKACCSPKAEDQILPGEDPCDDPPPGGGGDCPTFPPPPVADPKPCVEIEELEDPDQIVGVAFAETEAGKFKLVVAVNASTEEVEAAQAVTDTLAKQEAQSKLKCEWGSPKLEVKCCETPNVPGIPEKLEVCANFVIANSSGAAAAQAKAAALSLISCMYQNEGGGGGGYAICPDCTEPTDLSEVSLPAGYVISPISILEANKEAQRLADSMVLCTLCNEEEKFTCEQKAADQPPPGELFPQCNGTAVGNTPGISWIFEPASGMYKAAMHEITVPKCAFEIYANLDQVRTDTTPDPETWPRTYESNCEPLQEAVDKQAKQFAYAELGECLVPNPTTHAKCDPESELEWVVNEVVACEGLFMAKTEAIALEQAQAYLVSQLNCLYGNDEQEEDADPGCLPGEVEKKGKVAKDTFILSTKESSDKAAVALAKALAMCLPDFGGVNGECDFMTHPWKLCVEEDGLGGLNLNVASGSFIPCDASTQTSPDSQFPLQEGTLNVWVKVTYSANTKASSELTAIEVEQPGPAIPADTDTVTYWLIGTVTVISVGVAPDAQLTVTALVQKMFEDVRLCDDSNSDTNRHSWFVSAAEPPSGALMLDVESGKVTSETGTVFTYAGGQVSGFTQGQVYLKLNYSGSEELVGIDVESAATMPANTATEKYMLIADVKAEVDGQGYERLTERIQRLTEDVILKGDSAKKVGKFDLQINAITPGDPPTCDVTYKGGTLYAPPHEFAIDDDTSTSCSGSYWLKVTRDPSSRAATSAVLEVLGVGVLPSADDYNTQYVFLMEYDLTQTPVYWSQTRSGIVAILEQMILHQGLIKLVTVDLAARSMYEPPP